jgi:CubicO group peptidase (beta-lactamase class C family)
MAAAGLWTTPSDLARWAIALSRSYRGEPGGVLSPAMAKQMISKQVHQQPPFGTGYWGLGVAVAGDADSLTFSHGGRDEGFVADVFMRPNTGRGFVVMMNGVAGGLMTEVERAYAEEYGFGAPLRITRTVVSIPVAKLGEYAGRYVGIAGNDTTRIDVSVTADGKMLALYNSASKRSIPIAPLGGDRFVGLEGGGEWAFERVEGAGAVTSLALGAGPNRRVLVRQ